MTGGRALRLAYAFACSALFLDCHAPARWTEAGAYAPARAAIDVNHDGRVDKDEYQRVAFAAPDFEAADLDHDADLSLAEMTALVDGTDPKHFFTIVDVHTPKPARHPHVKKNQLANEAREAEEARAIAARAPPPPPDPTTPAPPPSKLAPAADVSAGPVDADVLRPVGISVNPPEAYYVLLVLRDEVRSVDPTIPVPDDITLRDVGWKGSLTSPDAKAVLAQLQTASAAAHVDFPAAFRQ